MLRSTLFATLLFAVTLSAQDSTRSLEDTSTPVAKAPAATPLSPTEMLEKWGVRVSALRLTAADMMLDLRVHVLDVNKAESLFSTRTAPVLINPATGHQLQVPNTPTAGSLRPVRVSEPDRDYSIIFGNAFRQVRHGDKVKLKIGDFEADVTVQ